ncbi:hypothetical protein OBBRIDRAFT_829808 [Obba rivulosa]|uniref:C2 domain-containing protein n=1 Tax=Obba rivulosa TaxID=1052685 RepID=A0A8E2AHV0_9APHY|nr:hypothetical protein OBBRIDRAFT_829808 [Obba rivulosa]
MILPSIFAYCMLFRLRNVSDDDFERQVWHAEQMGVLRVGSEVDGAGQVSDEERTRESTEWANATMRGVWPILNLDLSHRGYHAGLRPFVCGLGSNAARITAFRSLSDAIPENASDSGEGGDLEKSLDINADAVSQEERDALDGDRVNLEMSFAYRGQPSGNEDQSKAHNIHRLGGVTPAPLGLLVHVCSSYLNHHCVDAIGVLVVHTHRATGVKSTVANGKSDLYATLAFSRLGKYLDSTRIIKGDAVLLIGANTIKLREKLSFQPWDSDRMSVDDMMGFHELDIADFIQKRSQPMRRVVPLQSSGSQARPDSLREKPEFKEACGAVLSDLEAAVHEIRDLTVKRQGKEKRGEKGREDEKGEDEREEAAEEAEGLPSTYCVISLNDEMVYQTRVKPVTGSPIFNAGTEPLVRDWRKSHVIVTPKDFRMRENGAVLSIVFLKLSELLVDASELTRFYSLEKGLGYRRIRVSLLFSPVQCKLPPSLIGFDTGTLEVRDVAVKSDRDDFSRCEVRLKTTISVIEDKVSRKQAQKREDGLTVWSKDGAAIAVRQRYGAALLVSFCETSEFKKYGRKALGVLWLCCLVDSEEGKVKITLWRDQHGDYSRLKLNCVPPDGDLNY